MQNKKLIFYASLFTTFLTLVTFGIAFFTPPLSGPWCREASCYSYPFTDIASRFPRDYYWMCPAIVLYLSYIVLMVCISQRSPAEKKVYSQIGVIFATISALILITDYFLQLSVIQPSLVNKEYDGISLLTQYNSHGIFIALEELGNLFMSLGFLFMAQIFGKTKLENSIKWIFISSFVLNILSFAYFSFSFGVFREYKFELVTISINWLTLIISGVLLSLLFWNKSEKNSIL